MKVAIYGGSFDPVHQGHIAVIEAALKRLEIDKLLIIPAFLNPFKTQTFATASKRLEWMKKIAQAYEKVEVLDIEASLSKPSTSYDTLQKLKLRYNFDQRPYLIIGADNVDALPRWYRFEALKHEVEFVVASRKDYVVPPEYQKLEVLCDISSTALRLKMDKEALPVQIADEVMNYYKESFSMEERIKKITAVLDSKKAEDIEVVYLDGQDYIADAVIIVTSLNERHGESLLNELKTELKPQGEEFVAVDDSTAAWIVVDLGDIIIHIMTQAYRDKYTIEKFLEDLKKGVLE